MRHQNNTLTFCFKLESDNWLSFHVSLLSASSFCPSVTFVSCEEKQTPCHRLEQVLWTCSAGDIVTKIWTGWLRNCGLISNTPKILSLFSKCPDWLQHPTNLLFIQYHGLSSLQVSSQGVKLTTCAFSAEVKNEWCYNSTPPHIFRVCPGALLSLLFTSPRWR